MATEKKVFEIIKEAGFEPIEDKGIVVKYAPENLSAKIANFFSMEFYVLQLCKDELVLVPFSTITAGLKKEVTLQIPYTYIITLSHRDNKDGSASGHFVSKLGRAAAEVTARFFAGSNSPSRCPAKTARLPQIQFSHRLRRC